MRLETYQHLVDILETSNTPMSTQEIATKIQLSRSVTSLYLNKLLEKGEVQQPPRPMCFDNTSVAKAAPKKPSNNAKPLCCIPHWVCLY